MRQTTKECNRFFDQITCVINKAFVVFSVIVYYTVTGCNLYTMCYGCVCGTSVIVYPKASMKCTVALLLRDG